VTLPIIATLGGQQRFLDALAPGLSRPPRLAITGGPNTGKTTATDDLAHMAAFEGARVRHTDDAIDEGWSEASETVADWFGYEGGLIVEGVAVPRGLRKWLRRGSPGTPVDAVVVLTHTFIPPSDGQLRMAKGVATVLAEIRPELEERGVVFVEVP